MQQNKMTREEATRMLQLIFKGIDANTWIGFFIETGMLQVEEEKTAEQKVRAIFAGRVIRGHGELLDELNANNLKIVEK